MLTGPQTMQQTININCKPNVTIKRVALTYSKNLIQNVTAKDYYTYFKCQHRTY